MARLLDKEIAQLDLHISPQVSGRVTHVIGLLIESQGPDSFVGELCYIYGKNGTKIACEVVGFKEKKVLLMSFGDAFLISPGSEVYPTGMTHKISVSEKLKGRILDALGKPIDGKGDILAETFYPVSAAPPAPLSRPALSCILETKIKAIDGLCTLAKGQRVGIFSPPGVGKTTLSAMIARNAKADINVIALVGERGREVREFIEKDLEETVLARSVIVVATSDQAALLRTKAASVATAIAEYFRDKGMDVLLMMDSITRYCMALREIGLAIGEPPATKGFTPSVFASLPKLLERAGTSSLGSITGIYTILSEDAEMYDPVADQIRSLLDGHISLNKDLAFNNHFPPIDILKSLSRTMNRIVHAKHQKHARKFRSILQVYKEASELIQLGAYVKGSNPKIDEAIQKFDRIEFFLIQSAEERFSLEATLNLLESIDSVE